MRHLWHLPTHPELGKTRGTRIWTNGFPNRLRMAHFFAVFTATDLRILGLIIHHMKTTIMNALGASMASTVNSRRLCKSSDHTMQGTTKL